MGENEVTADSEANSMLSRTSGMYVCDVAVSRHAGNGIDLRSACNGLP